MQSPMNARAAPSTDSGARRTARTTAPVSLRNVALVLTLALRSDAFAPASRLSGNARVISETMGFDDGRSTGAAANINTNIRDNGGRRSGATELPMVWWFGGTENGELTTESDESCELVAVRIERTSANSRRIGGEITIDRPIDDVWAILTDYDNLAVHVPNLVESKRVTKSGRGRSSTAEVGEQGDGAYKCRLFQKGSQKIVGFQFAASVTMDMKEGMKPGLEADMPEERSIGFKCVDSQFFSEFDGEWRAMQSPTPDPLTGLPITTVSYVVDVRPKGPVPVAALEWRIREDVPTNLRAVKKAALEVGYEGVMQMRNGFANGNARTVLIKEELKRSVIESESTEIGNRRDAALRTGRQIVDRATTAVTTAAANASAAAQQVKSRPKLAPVRVDWFEDETMAAYLKE